MANLVILAGIPGCGKSTWAKSLFDLKYKVVSTDEIRKRIWGSLKAAHDGQTEEEKPNNGLVFSTFHANIHHALMHDVDVVADATFLSKESRDVVREIADFTNSKLHLVLFKNIQQAIDRNWARDEDARVPDDVMEHMLGKYFNTLHEISQESYASVLRIESYA